MRSALPSRVAGIFCVLLLSVLAPSSLVRAQDDNGIAVGRAKLFDNRTLLLMLQQLDESLRTVQAINPPSIATAVGQLQGSQTSELLRSFQATGLPAGAEEQQVKTTVGPTGTNTESTQKTTTAAPSLSPPQLPQAQPAPAEPKYGLAAQDLLTEQINLTYQVFNLRMLLERAMSDRLYNGEQRLNAVLGFEISINPQRRFRDAAAVVEVSLCVKNAAGCDAQAPGAEPISTVALMPQEKTYNMAVLDKRANAFSGALPAKVLTIGYSEQRRGETYFLYQDSDTFAFEKQPKTNMAGVTVGWQFRPVFDRRAVDPGLRQVFAVVALPHGVKDRRDVNIKVRTFWTKYDGGKAGVTDQKVLKGVEGRDEYVINLRHSDELADELGPDVEKVSWRRLGTDNVLLDIGGRNFYPGTTVLVGAAVMDSPQKGLVTKSDQRLQLVTTLRDVMSSNMMLSGRYGQAIEIIDSRLAKYDGKPGWGLQITRVHWHLEPERLTTTLTIELLARCRPGAGRGSDPPNFRDMPLIVSIGDQFISTDVSVPTVETREQLDVDQNCQPASTPSKVAVSSVSIEVPNAILEGERLLRVRVPFASRDFSDAGIIYPYFRVDRVVRVSDSPTVLDIIGAGFKEEEEEEKEKDKRAKIWVYADKKYESEGDGLQLFGTTVMRLTTKASPLMARQLIVCCRLGAEPVAIAIPSSRPDPLEPKFAKTKASVKQESVGSVDFEGENLSAVRTVSFEDKVLASEVSQDGKKLTVRLTREVTKTSGVTVELLAKADSGRVLQALIVEITAK